ncbi:MAG: tryptophan--tRNA ligase [Armatimonadota bacterium]|nr:tryptophan--tRNA ligase [Armatimonadota bacterium]MDR7444717.1 tryptophan--tRNA ligase [Armatimonadota bacterium]MDR7570874.1 tryptophan--tRNA ligase [Armatimonadota bacterium]MDR7613278.1 tryptophan--tRNA ligase [Armatimonadota bacterium]
MAQKVGTVDRAASGAAPRQAVRVFSGIQPTGLVHLGNYVGAIRQWVELQAQYESYFCIVDLHAITVPYEPEEMQRRILEAAAANIAAGIDPERSVLFVQSHVHQHCELMWLLTTLTPVGQLERMTQYKEKARRARQGVMAGLLNYPVLQAADVLLYKASLVPVGEDQLQHIELMRDLAERFNKQFGETFPLPEARLTKGARIMALNDPTKKMSKSIPGSYIALADEPEEIRRKVRAAVTDPGPPAPGARVEDASPGVQNLFTLLEIFGPEHLPRFREAYESGTIRYSELKQVLAEAIVERLDPIRRRYHELLRRPGDLYEILVEGARRARPVAEATMEEVYRKMGLR